MLTVRDIAAMPGLGLEVVAGSDGLDNAVTWLHVSELEDPTPFLEGGEFLLTTGLGVGELATTQRAYVRRLAEHGLAGLGFGVGFGFVEAPAGLVAEADRMSFPLVNVPYEVPFVAITKAAVSHLANDQLEQLERALGVHERLAEAVLEGRGVEALLAVVCNHLDCSLALVDENGRVVAERHARRRLPFKGALELPVVAHEEMATLKATRANGAFGEYDRLVLHHGQTALAFELSRRRAVSAAELRLAGDLLDDLEVERLDDRETTRRMAAFGLESDRDYAALLAVPRDGSSGERLREEVAKELDSHRVRYLSTAHRDRAAFLVEASEEDAILALARGIVEAEPQARVGVGRPARGRALGRRLL
jgi:PucR family transcriptional regulator, purine catabolism regulatory protein